jgi:hypothetical protein
MQKKLALLAALILTACGGGSGSAPFPVESAYDTAVIGAGNSVDGIYESDTYTVHRDGSAQHVSVAGTTTKTSTTALSSATVSALFSDLQAAQPLNALPAGSYCGPEGLTVSWNGEQSPDINCPANNAAEQTLRTQIGVVIQAFGT